MSSTIYKCSTLTYCPITEELLNLQRFSYDGAVAQFSFLPSSESRELANDIQDLLDDLARSLPHQHRAYSGECRPTLDVLETDEAIEVTVDLSGVPAEAVRVLFRSGVLIIVGEKAPSPATADQTFHLVER